MTGRRGWWVSPCWFRVIEVLCKSVSSASRCPLQVDCKNINTSGLQVQAVPSITSCRLTPHLRSAMSITRGKSRRLLHERALRATAPRLAVLRVLAEALGPLSLKGALVRPRGRRRFGARRSHRHSLRWSNRRPRASCSATCTRPEPRAPSSGASRPIDRLSLSRPGENGDNEAAAKVPGRPFVGGRIRAISDHQDVTDLLAAGEMRDA